VKAFLYVLEVKLKSSIRLFFKTGKSSKQILKLLAWVFILCMFLMFSVGSASFFSTILKKSPEIASMIYTIQMAFVAFMFIIQLVPAIATDLFDPQSSFRYFLYLPIKKQYLIIISLMNSIAIAILPAIFFLTITIGYLIANPNLFSIITMISILFAIAGISLLISLSISRISRKGGTRRLVQLSMIFNLIIFIVIWNVAPKLHEELGKSIQSGGLNEILKFDPSMFPGLRFISHGVAGSPFHASIILCVAIIIWLAIWRFASGISLSEGGVSTKRSRIVGDVFKYKSWPKPFFNRDLLFMVRDAESLMALLLPIFFVVFFTLSFGRNIIAGLSGAMVITTQQAAIISAKLTTNDTVDVSFSLGYPIKWKNIFIARALEMSFIFLFLIVISAQTMAFFSGCSFLNFQSVIVMFLCIFGSSCWGQWRWITHPKRGEIHPKKIIGFEIIIAGFITVFLVILTNLNNLGISNPILQKIFFGLSITSIVIAMALAYFVSTLLSEVRINQAFQR